MRRTTLILIILFAISLTASAITLRAPSRQPAEGNSCNVILIIEHRDSRGELIERRVKEGDLLLENFAKFLKAIMGAQWVKLTKIDGTTNYADDGETVSTDSYNTYIVLGNGTAAASISDYRLVNQVVQQRVGSIGVTSSGNQVNATISASITFTESYTIREIGLKARTYRSNASQFFYWLVCRDDISSNPISVQSNDTLTVTYVFKLN